MGGLREIDQWFCERVFPHERLFLWQARRLAGNGDAADDLLQDAYAQIFVGDRWREIENPKAYVLSAIRNLGLNRIRKARVVPIQQLAQIETLDYADMAPDAHDRLSMREELEAVLSAIARLPQQRRIVLHMRRVEGLSPAVIAQRLGLSEKTVKNHLGRGLAQLADLLAEHGTDSPASSAHRRARQAVMD